MAIFNGKNCLNHKHFAHARLHLERVWVRSGDPICEWYWQIFYVIINSDFFINNLIIMYYVYALSRVRVVLDFQVKTSLGVHDSFGNKCTKSCQYFIATVFTVMHMSFLGFFRLPVFLLTIKYCLIVSFRRLKL